MAWRQAGLGHLVDISNVPGRDYHAPRIGVVLYCIYNVFDLVNVPTIGRRPVAPLVAVDRAELSPFFGERIIGLNFFGELFNSAFPPLAIRVRNLFTLFYQIMFVWPLLHD